MTMAAVTWTGLAFAFIAAFLLSLFHVCLDSYSKISLSRFLENWDKAVKDCWYWQMAYWILEDVAATVEQMLKDLDPSGKTLSFFASIICFKTKYEKFNVYTHLALRLDK